MGSKKAQDLVAGREMDALVAEKVMAIRFCSRVGVHDPGDCDSKYHRSDRPRYSTDIAAAWDVARKLDMKLDLTPGGVWAYVPYVPPSENFCDSAPLAICRAALKALEE